jgi:tRNA nucleotidyltransferase (CCA-adding enzyme)
MTRVPGKSYVVGGAVRDRLLGLPVSDRDHVVVGATVDEMKAAGFRPVGRDFPVFLHPETHEEYALARTERKVAPGYAGFLFHADPSVTLEADLERRDLTINAIAEDETDGRLVDPFGGQRDLADKLFRHVGPAFVEDPVRILRLARFAARFVDFRVAPETLSLMRSMADAGEIDALVPERVWQELSRGLMEARPSRVFDVLREAHALQPLLPEIDALAAGDWQRTAVALARAADDGQVLEVRFAVLTQMAGGGAIERLCERFAVPRAVRDVALLVAREARGLLAVLDEGRSPAADFALVETLDKCDAFRRKDRFLSIENAVALTIDDEEQRQKYVSRMAAVIAATHSVDAAAIARSANGDVHLIPQRLRTSRAAAISQIWKNASSSS